jgi:hypothetical protein
MARGNWGSLEQEWRWTGEPTHPITTSTGNLFRGAERRRITEIVRQYGISAEFVLLLLQTIINTQSTQKSSPDSKSPEGQMTV